MKRDAAVNRAMRMRLKGTMASLNMRSIAQKPKAPSKAPAVASGTAAEGNSGAAMRQREAASMAAREPNRAQRWALSGTMRRASSVAAMPNPA